MPDGTLISAWIGGVKYAEAASLTYQGLSSYVLTVPGDDPVTEDIKEGGLPGEGISFKIGSLPAEQTASWQEAGSTWLNLTAAGVVGTPTPTRTGVPPTATATRTPTVTPTATRTATPARPTPTPVPTSLVLSQAADAYIFEDYPSANYGREGELRIKTGQRKRPLIKFDLSMIPPQARVESAQMMVWANWYTHTTWPMNVQCYPLKRPWVENEVTWLNAAEGQPWRLPGAEDTRFDREITPVSSVTVQLPDTLYTFDITSVAQTWVADPATNHGLILIGQGNIAEYRFWSAQYIDPSLRPKLSVRFSLPAVPTPTCTVGTYRLLCPLIMKS